MIDGYYLSTYLNPSGLHRLAHVSYRHDNNVSLWRKTASSIELLAHWELERLSGLKHHRTPFADLDDMREFLDSLLVTFGVRLDDMVEVWGTPELATTDDYHLVTEQPEIAFHSLAHLYSAMLLDGAAFFGGDVLGFAVDRGPDRLLDRRFKNAWFAGGFSRAGELSLFPVDSPGPLYAAAKDNLKLREGTLMALATATKAYGSCDRDSVLADYDLAGIASMAHAGVAFDRVAAQVRDSMTPDPGFSERESYISAVMKEIQAISVLLMERNVERAIDRFSIDPMVTSLAMSGGFALNCPTNSHLMAKYGFQDFMAPPGVDDGGQAVGIGLAAFHKKTDGARFDFIFPGPYLGREDHDLAAALEEFAAFVEFDGRADLATDVVDIAYDLAVQDIQTAPVAWFAGRSEMGPRALGNRSLLADPTAQAAKAELNAIKVREWWRPVAPVVLEEHLAEWFKDSRPSPYMLETFIIRGDRRHLIPAVAHLDDSARVQSVRRPDNPLLHALLTSFYRRTKVPMLCNTSLNSKGEPIIDSIREAFNFCLRRRVAVGYFNGHRVTFHNFDAYSADQPYPRIQTPFVNPSADRSAAIHERLNPYGLSDLYLHILLLDFTLNERFDLTTQQGAQGAREAVRARLDAEPELGAAAGRTMRRAAQRFTAFTGEQATDRDLSDASRVSGV